MWCVTRVFGDVCSVGEVVVVQEWDSETDRDTDSERKPETSSVWGDVICLDIDACCSLGDDE